MVVFALVCVFAAAGASAAETPRVPLHGIVKKAVAGTCLQDDPCDGIARQLTLVFSRHGRAVARATTNSRGQYRMRLRAGRYSVRVAASSLPVRPDRVRIGSTPRTINFFVGHKVRPQ
jgi:hypothetical protein